MKKLFSFFVVISCLACSTDHTKDLPEDCPNYIDNITKRKIYTFVDTMPEYPGGQSELSHFFTMNFTYPNVKQFQGSIFMEFVIDTDGCVFNERIVKKDMKNLTLVDQEGLRILRKMPNWKPGKCNGKAVPVRMIFPVRF
ncbi:energy transducer TonB [Cytophagaceae bacterium YF14B1]|uniref:Energy transducer TonB n=1 Tax=Xanthocytophaga flava TaxID=3048013 RepID=A0AAE3QWS4_9BACT|nr:energy transducer TonB [Xanthocytophaga flavus]MDJ1484940.1 energy transducer TonB [Xanthocytophaga flavus]